jgi:ATP-binding cassette subfamily B protein
MFPSVIQTLKRTSCAHHVYRPTGETTAIFGSKGSGKSTVINLIPRFFDVTEARFLVVGGMSEKLRNLICGHGLVTFHTRGILFSGTVGEQFALCQ